MKAPLTEITLIRDLRTKINTANTQRVNKADAITPLVKEYWEDPRNKLARDTDWTGEQAGRSVLSQAIDMMRPERTLINKTMIEKWLPWLIRQAQTDKLGLQALSELLALWLRSDQELPEEIREATADFIEGKFRPKRQGRRRDPQVYHANLQTALAVFAVYEETNGEFSLAAVSQKITAFQIVANATGQEYDAVREAWRQHKHRLKPKKRGK